MSEVNMIRVRPVIGYDLQGVRYLARPNRFNERFYHQSKAIKEGTVITLEAALAIIADKTHEEIEKHGRHGNSAKIWSSDWAITLKEMGYRVEIKPEDWEVAI
jgi:hypothetical protein